MTKLGQGWGVGGEGNQYRKILNWQFQGGLQQKTSLPHKTTKSYLDTVVMFCQPPNPFHITSESQTVSLLGQQVGQLSISQYTDFCSAGKLDFFMIIILSLYLKYFIFSNVSSECHSEAPQVRSSTKVPEQKAEQAWDPRPSLDYRDCW